MSSDDIMLAIWRRSLQVRAGNRFEGAFTNLSARLFGGRAITNLFGINAIKYRLLKLTRAGYPDGYIFELT